MMRVLEGVKSEDESKEVEASELELEQLEDMIELRPRRSSVPSSTSQRRKELTLPSSKSHTSSKTGLFSPFSLQSLASTPSPARPFGLSCLAFSAQFCSLSSCSVSCAPSHHLHNPSFSRSSRHSLMTLATLRKLTSTTASLQTPHSSSSLLLPFARSVFNRAITPSPSVLTKDQARKGSFASISVDHPKTSSFLFESSGRTAVAARRPTGGPSSVCPRSTSAEAWRASQLISHEGWEEGEWEREGR